MSLLEFKYHSSIVSETAYFPSPQVPKWTKQTRPRVVFDFGPLIALWKHGLVPSDGNAIRYVLPVLWMFLEPCIWVIVWLKLSDARNDVFRKIFIIKAGSLWISWYSTVVNLILNSLWWRRRRRSLRAQAEASKMFIVTSFWLCLVTKLLYMPLYYNGRNRYCMF